MHRTLTAVAAAALVAAAAGPADAARVRTVTIEDIEFSPSTVRIDRGDRVRWEWRDGVTPHDVKSRGKRDLSVMPEGLVSNLTPSELAHLLAYLESLPAH